MNKLHRDFSLSLKTNLLIPEVISRNVKITLQVSSHTGFRYDNSKGLKETLPQAYIIFYLLV